MQEKEGNARKLKRIRGKPIREIYKKARTKPKYESVIKNLKTNVSVEKLVRGTLQSTRFLFCFYDNIHRSSRRIAQNLQFGARTYYFGTSGTSVERLRN